MAEYKLELALPQSQPGSTEVHYGRVCNIRLDPNGVNSVYAELSEAEAKNYLIGGRIRGPVVTDDGSEVEPPSKSKEKPKRKRRTKAEIKADEEAEKEPEVVSARFEATDPMDMLKDLEGFE